MYSQNVVSWGAAVAAAARELIAWICYGCPGGPLASLVHIGSTYFLQTLRSTYVNLYNNLITSY